MASERPSGTLKYEKESPGGRRYPGLDWSRTVSKIRAWRRFCIQPRISRIVAKSRVCFGGTNCFVTMLCCRSLTPTRHVRMSRKRSGLEGDMDASGNAQEVKKIKDSPASGQGRGKGGDRVVAGFVESCNRRIPVQIQLTRRETRTVRCLLNRFRLGGERVRRTVGWYGYQHLRCQLQRY